MWSLVLGIFGALGIGGAIAALVLVPGLWPIAANLAVKWLGAAVKAITTAATWCMRQAVSAPAWTAVLLLMSLLAGWLFGAHEYSRGKVACETAHKAAAAIEEKRHTVAITGAKDASKPRTDRHAKEDQTNKQQVKNVTEIIAARPDGGDECIDTASADRLRLIH